MISRTFALCPTQELVGLKAAYFSILRQAVGAGIRLDDDAELREAFGAYRQITAELYNRVQVMRAAPHRYN